MMISCGAALFTARLALRSLGYVPEAQVLPDPGDPTWWRKAKAPRMRGARHAARGHHRGASWQTGAVYPAWMPTGA
jgi:hypothetical protein